MSSKGAWSFDTDAGKDDVMTERRREGIDTDKKDEVKLEIYDEDEHGQVDEVEKRDRVRPPRRQL